MDACLSYHLIPLAPEPSSHALQKGASSNSALRRCHLAAKRHPRLDFMTQEKLS